MTDLDCKLDVFADLVIASLCLDSRGMKTCLMCKYSSPTFATQSTALVAGFFMSGSQSEILPNFVAAECIIELGKCKVDSSIWNDYFPACALLVAVVTSQGLNA